MRIIYDAAFPPAAPPAADGVLVYIGGDTPNPVTTYEQLAQWGDYRFYLPTFVRDNPSTASPVTDARFVLNWLTQFQVPRGSTIVLDLETAVDPSYVSAFGSLIRPTYPVLVYGSPGTQTNPILSLNPALDGYFVASPGAPTLPFWPSPTHMRQYYYSPAYDLSVVGDNLTLWDREPPQPTEDEMALSAVVTPDGKLHVFGVGIDNGRENHALHFISNTDTSNPTKNPLGWSVNDITGDILATYPTALPYTVAD